MKNTEFNKTEYEEWRDKRFDYVKCGIYSKIGMRYSDRELILIYKKGFDIHTKLTKKQKRQKIIYKAKIKKDKFNIHTKLKKEIFGNIKPEFLKVIFKKGAIDDLFTLQMIEYAEKYHESELNRLRLNVTTKTEKLICSKGIDNCNYTSKDLFTCRMIRNCDKCIN